MKNHFRKIYYQQAKLLVVIIIAIFTLSSCDKYTYDDSEPEWLGSSIYDYLKTDGHYTNFVQLIDTLNYDEVLNLTGSKTLFVANDSAFVEFFKNNEWGVTRFDQLTRAQMKILFNYSMINNAYVMDVYSNFYSGGTLYEGTAMRRQSALSNIDSIPFDTDDKVPSGVYWNYYKTKGIHLIKDYSLLTSGNNASIPIVFFTQDFLNKYALTNEDFSVLSGGLTRNNNDVFIFNSKIIQKDIVCKNGYINVLDRVLLPPSNMAQYIKNNSTSTIAEKTRTSIFSKLLDRFSAPYYDEANTLLYRQLHPDFKDSIFAKCYFSNLSGATRYPIKGKPEGLTIPYLLPFNPGWNSYKAAALQADMAAMFVPSDEAMNNYFNSEVGEILKKRFGTWDNVPDEIILSFVKRHMRPSLIESLPSKFSKMVDAENYALPVQKSHVETSYTSVNGEVYITNQVYPPVDFISVYGPALFSENTKIMNWAINISETSVDGTKFAFYKLYLNSLVSRYSLFIPTDEYLASYIDPIAYGQDVSGALKFWFNATTNAVNATVYKYDKVTGNISPDSIDVITNAAFIKNRLWNILDSHIVVGGVETGKDYFITKANDLIKVSGTGTDMSIQGGGDLAANTKSNVTRLFNQTNGNTYFLDKPIQPSLASTYKVLRDTPEFSMFFELLNNVPDTCIQQIFAQQGIDTRIKFFNAYRYTVYVPTNEAIEKALTDGRIWNWSTIESMATGSTKKAAISKMIRFLKYHFQDNAVFSNQVVNIKYQSATIKTDTTKTLFATSKNKYYKIGVLGNGSTLTLTMDSKNGDPVRIAKVVTSNNLHDIVVKDYIFGKIPSLYKFVDGTGTASGALFNTSTITTSASAVIHQIDNVLTIE